MTTEPAFANIFTAIERLNAGASRVGRTHVHKFLYLAEAWSLLPTQHRFSMYLHGPYSRELDGEILALRAAGLIEVTPDSGGFGARYSVPQRLASSRPIVENLDALTQLGNVLGPMLVTELEALATCEFLKTELSLATPQDLLRAVKAVKPHLSDEAILQANSKLEGLRGRVLSISAGN